MRTVNLLLLILIVASALMLGCGGGTASGSGSGSGRTGAVSWQLVNTPFPEANYIDFGSNGHWFAADRSHGFFVSTDSGSTWSPINSGIATNFGWTINAVPNSTDLIAGIYSPGGPSLHPVFFYRSSNEGSSWTVIQSVQLDQFPAWSGCVFAGNGNAVCGGYWAASPASGGWYSNNGGQTVSAATTTSTNGTAVFSLALNPVKGDLWMGTEQYGVFRSSDNGVTWSPASPPDKQISAANGILDGNALAISFDRNGNVLFASQGGVWKSSGSGSGMTWTNVKANPAGEDGTALTRDANGVLYYGHAVTSTDPVTLYCSVDDGNSWQACDNGLPPSIKVGRMVVNPTDKRMYAIVLDEPNASGKIYRTVNPVQ